MKLIAALAVAAIAAAAPPATQLADQDGYERPATPWTDITESERRKQCADRLEHAKSVGGEPRIDRQPATPDGPAPIYAVDLRVEGCPVLVPVGARAPAPPSSTTADRADTDPAAPAS